MVIIKGYVYDKVAIGKRIDHIRKTVLRNMSKAELGKNIGITGNNLGVVISGKANFSLPILIKFCAFAKVSSDYVLFGIENEYIDIEKVNHAISAYNESIAKDKFKTHL